MSRENALRLIRATIFEFHKDVMIPLNGNIRLYDWEHNADAIRLHEQFYDFSEAVQDIYSVASNVMEELGELDNFQLSQLLSLCRDISELYSLPIFEHMSDFIPDNSPIKYVDPDATSDSNAQKLAELNARILGEIISMANSETDNGRQQLLELIINGLNHMDPAGERIIITKIEEKMMDVADLHWKLEFIENILPLFPNNRKIMDDFLEELRTANLPSARDLSKLIERRDAILRAIAENGDETAGGIGNGSVETMWETIKNWFSSKGWDFGFLPPRVSWRDENTTIEASLDLPSSILGLSFTHCVMEDTTLSMIFEYNLSDREIMGSVGISRLTIERGLAGFNIDGSFEYSKDGILKVKFDFGTALPLNKYSHMDIWGSVTASGDNPEASVGLVYNREEGNVIGRIGSELGTSVNSTTALFFGSFNLGSNVSIGTDIKLHLPGSSGAGASPSFNIYLKLCL
jgi:hypothetical protein